jgi:hypothetical protein
MYVLLITNVDKLELYQWSQLHRLGQAHFSHHPTTGRPEVFLEVPSPIRRNAADYKVCLPQAGFAVKGAYRDAPEFDVRIPAGRLEHTDYSERSGYPTGTLAVAYYSGSGCPWCESGELRLVKEYRADDCRTILFCYTCRRIVYIMGWHPREDWPRLAEAVRGVPRPPALFVETERSTGHQAIVDEVRRMSPAKKRILGIGGIPRSKHLAG